MGLSSIKNMFVWVLVWVFSWGVFPGLSKTVAAQDLGLDLSGPKKKRPNKKARRKKLRRKKPKHRRQKPKFGKKLRVRKGGRKLLKKRKKQLRSVAKKRRQPGKRVRRVRSKPGSSKRVVLPKTKPSKTKVVVPTKALSSTPTPSTAKPTKEAMGGLQLDLTGPQTKIESQAAKTASTTGAAQEGLGLESLDVSVKSEAKEALDKALDMMKDEDYADAAIALWELYNNPSAKRLFESAEYQLAKALYRMRMYQSSLHHFGRILEKGSSHKYFKTSLEWLLFISHKVTDQKVVLDYIARYADMDFPKKYKDEFQFLLAKYFYFHAMNLELGKAKSGSNVKDQAKKKDSELGFDLSEDDSTSGGLALDLGASDGVAQTSNQTGTEDSFGLDLKDEKQTGPTALPTDVVGFLSKARAMTLQLGENSKFFPRGKYLEGIIFFKEDNHQEAVESFKEVVRILHPKTGKFRDDRLREMAFFQLARVHYGHQQFKYALFYYDRITRDSTNWLESLFESSWAWFRLGNYQKSLGNLITLDSPFFRDEYFPEGLVLKAVTYFVNCRYPESNQIVNEFLRRYQPLHAELEKLTQPNANKNYFESLLAVQKDATQSLSNRLLRRILKVAMADKDLALLNNSVLEIDREIDRVRHENDAGFSASKVAQRVIRVLNTQRADLVAKADTKTKNRLDAERDFLGDLIAKALRIRLENKDAELQMLKRAKAGDLDLGPTLLTYDWSAATDDEKVYWPYEGEYWRDELGTYEYTLTWGCRKQVE
jgi:TolA-binding protein